MDSGAYRLRPFATADYEAIAAIDTIIQPTMPATAEDERRWDDLVTRDPARLLLRQVAEDRHSGATVAWGSLGHGVWNYHPRKFYLRVAVHPLHRRRGIGQALYALLEEKAGALGAVALWASVREDDEPSVRFLARHGYVPLRKTWFSRLDLSQPVPSRVPDRSHALREQGIRITTIAAEGPDRPEVRRRLYELSRISSEDVPRVGEYTPTTYDEFVEVELAGPRVFLEALFVACHGDDYVGWTSLQHVLGLPDTLDIGFTGTLPAYRGRGIASELKRQAVEFARARGYRAITTANDSLNPRIWAINEKLGFRQESVYLQAEKAMPPAAP